MRLAAALSCAAAAALLASCEDAVGGDQAVHPEHAGGAAPAPWFSEEAAARGLVFTQQSGARGDYLMPEIMSGGAALFDTDGDGDLDAYLVQSGAPLDAPETRPPNQLFENSGSGTFTDVTAGSGADDRGIGMGVACGDADGDGDVDLFVANLGSDVLLANAGGGHFTDVTARAGVGDSSWSSSGAFFDADLDGDLDLWVCRYLNWIPAAEHHCVNHAGAPDYCNPTAYQAPALDSFFRNRGDGSYDDATRSAGIDRASTSLGVACLDADGDGWLDVFVANDQMPNQLWHNRGGVSFVDTGLAAGCAVDFDGAAKAGMGVAVGDPDGDGDTDLLVCNLENETDSMFENRGGYFADRSSAANLRTFSRRYTRFGVGWQDFDMDGLLDLYVANGRVMRLHPPLADDPYAEPNLVLRGLAGGRYEEVLPRGGTVEPLIATSRAAAFGDVDGDGAVDVLVVNRDGPAHLLMNRVPARGHWLTLRLLDEHGHDALNARLTAWAGEKRFDREARAAYSYQSSSTPFIHLGLGEATRVDRIEVRWPDGAVEPFGPYDAEQMVKLVRSAPRARPATAEPDTRAEFEAIAQSLRTGRNEFFGRAQVDALLARRRSSGVAPLERAREAVALTSELLRLGEVDEAVAIIEETLQEVSANPALVQLEPAVHGARGLAWLRKAERENCVLQHQPDSCIAPLAGGGVHAAREPAQKAMESYLVLAQRSPQDLEARWLLNVAAMAAGKWPDGLPEEHRIPASAFASEIDVGRFHDVAPRLGLDALDLAGGVVVDDLDG
ncbi:MAG TPA: CRTAC1 family protein, partial [Planctomycetota bacterium]|nr:CRTAC1 family protein [Planctomycetota bacterium]